MSWSITVYSDSSIVALLWLMIKATQAHICSVCLQKFVLSPSAKECYLSLLSFFTSIDKYFTVMATIPSCKSYTFLCILVYLNLLRVSNWCRVSGPYARSLTWLIKKVFIHSFIHSLKFPLLFLWKTNMHLNFIFLQVKSSSCNYNRLRLRSVCESMLICSCGMETNSF